MNSARSVNGGFPSNLSIRVTKEGMELEGCSAGGAKQCTGSRIRIIRLGDKKDWGRI